MSHCDSRPACPASRRTLNRSFKPLSDLTLVKSTRWELSPTAPIIARTDATLIQDAKPSIEQGRDAGVTASLASSEVKNRKNTPPQQKNGWILLMYLFPTQISTYLTTRRR